MSGNFVILDKLTDNKDFEQTQLERLAADKELFMSPELY